MLKKWHYVKNSIDANAKGQLLYVSFSELTPTYHTHVLLLPFSPKSSVEVVIREYYWLLLKLILVEKKYFYSVSILLHFETPTKISPSCLHPLTCCVQRKEFKFLPTRIPFLYGALNNGKGPCGYISSIFTM